MSIFFILLTIFLLGCLGFVLYKKVDKNSFKSFSFEVFKIFKAKVETHPNSQEILETVKKQNPAEYEKLQKNTGEKSKKFNWERDNIYFNKSEYPKSGFKDIDKIIYSFSPSNLIVVSGATSSGKTSLVINFSHKNSAEGVPVLFFSYEISSQQIIDKMLVSEARILQGSIKTSKISEEDFERLRKSLTKLEKFPLFIDDNPEVTLKGIEEKIISFKEKFPNGLVVLDSLELIYPDKEYTNQNEKIIDYIVSLKRIARKSNIPIIITCQLPRNYFKRGGHPRISDLQEGNIDQISDVVMFIYNEDIEEPNSVTEICIEKNRGGYTGRAEIYFDRSTSSFLNLERASLKDLQNF